MRKRELMATVRAAVEAGIPLKDVSSLRELLRPDHAETIIEHYWRKNGNRPTLYTIDLASKLLALARSDSGLTADEIARLDEIRICLEEYRSSGLTEKNRRLIREIAHTDVWRERNPCAVGRALDWRGGRSSMRLPGKPELASHWRA
jgi:hypothetical protein